MKEFEKWKNRKFMELRIIGIRVGDETIPGCSHKCEWLRWNGLDYWTGRPYRQSSQDDGRSWDGEGRP